MKRIGWGLAIGWFLAAAAAGSAYGAMDMFIKIGEIQGEAKDAEHPGWCEVLSWSWGMSQSGSAHAGGGGGGAGRGSTVAMDELVLTKAIDRASPKLMEALCTGQTLPMATIHVRRAAADGTQQTYMVYEMENVLIASIRCGGAAAAGQLPTEEISLRFGPVRFEYTVTDEPADPACPECPPPKVSYSWSPPVKK